MNKKNKKSISKKTKTKKNMFFSFGKPPKIFADKKAVVAAIDNSFWDERVPLFIALFLIAFGMGLIIDGKKIYNQQLKLSQRVDYKASLSTFSQN